MSGGRENDLIVSEIFTDEQREEIRRLAEEIAQAKIPRQLRREKVSDEIPVGRDALIWDADRGKWSPTPAIVFKDTQLTNDQVLDFRATPITLVAAPGANLANIVHQIMIVSDDAAGTWTESSDNLNVEYADGTNISIVILGSLLVGGGVQLYFDPMRSSSYAPDANAVIHIQNKGSGEWGGGNSANTMSVRLWYSTVPTVAFS